MFKKMSHADMDFTLQGTNEVKNQFLTTSDRSLKWHEALECAFTPEEKVQRKQKV